MVLAQTFTMDRKVRLQNYHRQLSTSLKSLDEIAKRKEEEREEEQVVGLEVQIS